MGIKEDIDFLKAQVQELRDANIIAAVDALDRLTKHERQAVFGQFCKHCGGEPGCQCWNDE